MPAYLTLAVALLLPQSSAGTIEGVVRGHLESPGVPLPFAVVQVRGTGVRRSALADSLGRYRIEGLPAGPVRLYVSHPGHAAVPLEVIVPAGRTVLVDVDLQRSPIGVDPLVVVGEPGGNPDDRPLGELPALPEMEVIALEGSPGLSEIGLGEAARTLPGNDPADPSDVLFMRGSTTDLKLVLLDGAPVYTPFHLGGLLDSFDATSLRGAALHVGGAPARYDGGLAYILDLRTRSPRRDRLRGRARADLLSGQLALEGPLGDRAGFALSSRALHGMGTPVLGGGENPYGFADALGKFEVSLSEQHRLTTTGFWNEESVFLDVDEGVDPVPRPDGPEDASWGNRAVSLAYRGNLDGFTLDAAAAASDYRATLPLRPSGEDAEAFVASAETNRLRLTVDASAPWDDSRIRFGAIVDHLSTAYEARTLDDATLLTRRRPRADGTVAGGYVDAVRRVAPDLSLRMGLRMDVFSRESTARLAPRAAVLWSVGPEALLTIAAGRYHQYTRASDTQVESAVAGASAGLTGDPLLSVATADHVLLSLEQQLGNRVRLDIEGFWKGFSGLGGPAAPPLRNSGVDIRVLRTGPEATAWVGYNLSWFWSGANVRGTSEFTGRQLLSAGLRGSLYGRTGVDLRVAYSAGLPYTSIPFGVANQDSGELGTPSDGGEDPGDPGDPSDELLDLSDLPQENPALAGEPADDFFRLDLELFTHFTTRIGGKATDLRVYLRLLNALDQRDALFFYFEPWRDDSLRPLAERSVLPVLGVEWRF